ncbi:MAG: hypothetical protein V1755_04935 [Chloroflexota bacterium]
MKDFLGQIPAAAVVYDALRPRRPKTRYNLEQLAARLPRAVEETRPFAAGDLPGSKLVLFATLHYWIEQAAILGLALRGMGHDVTIAYLPFSNWEKEINQFDLRRQDRYTRRVLAPLGGLVKVVSLLDMHADDTLPEALTNGLHTASRFDVMYSLQVEEVDEDTALYKLRMERNRYACGVALEYLRRGKADAALIPNALITELGVFYQAARFLETPTVTYEFNDQREQIWLAHDDIVMQQNTDGVWRARGSIPLTETEREKIHAFEKARESATTYGKGTRRWQDAPSQGSERLRGRLGLDSRPVVLLATNVLGDSLTLGRNIFATSMAEWIERTVAYFVGRPDVQLVVRVHPGERLIKGPSTIRVIERAAPSMPENLHVIGPAEEINTYDVMELASLGLAYTTTVGMEMAMRGVPVIAAGKTHYRDRGFAMAPTSWAEYFGMLDEVLRDPAAHRLTPQQIEFAWNYGYRFFFEYPFDFPWRLMHFWKDMEEWPLARVLSDEGQAAFGRTFRYLAGERITW